MATVNAKTIDGDHTTIEGSEIEKFMTSLRGQLIQPIDEGYDNARKLYNAMIDKHPALIAGCVDVADVITSIRFASENNLLVAIRGGGHNGPGLGSCDDGLVIDLSAMKGVHVDPEPSRAEALTTWARGYWEAVHSHTLGGGYVNFMMEEGEDRIKATYQDNYERLVEIKKKYDPDNRLRVNQNIKP